MFGFYMAGRYQRPAPKQLQCNTDSFVMQPDSCSKLPFNDNLNHRKQSGVLNSHDSARGAHITRVLDRVARGQQYSPEFCKLTGKMTAGIFLSRCLYWYRTMGRRPFHKANKGEGTAWMEQEGFQTRNEFYSARGPVATRVKKAQVSDCMKITPEMLDINEKGLANGLKYCVLYWKNGSKKMWYKVNEALIEALLLKQASPEADNVEVLWTVKARYPKADIVLPDLEPTVQTLPEEKLVLFPGEPDVDPMPDGYNPEGVEMYDEPIGPEPAPEPSPQGEKKKRKTYYKEVVAMAFGWKNDDGTPNPDAPLAGRMVSFLLGKSKRGKWKEWCLSDTPMSDAEIAGFWLWYREKTKREGMPKETLPVTPETLNRRALEFQSISSKNRASWTEKGELVLTKLAAPDKSSDSGTFYSPDTKRVHASPDWKKRSKEMRERKRKENADGVAQPE